MFSEATAWVSQGLPPIALESCRGELVEISGGFSSGKASLAFASCLRVLSAGRAVAWVDGGAGFWPLVQLEAGAFLDKLVVVRLGDSQHALKAAHSALAVAGAFALVVVHLVDRVRLNDMHLRKLKLSAERAGCAVVVLNEAQTQTGALGAHVFLRLGIRRHTPRAGLHSQLHIEVLRHKRGPLGHHWTELSYGPNRLRVDSTV